MSEKEILNIIHKYFPNENEKHLLGRGDDCAIIDVDTANSHLVVTTDIFAENSHFRTSYFPPESIGHKALAVNISDVYSMGAMPLSAQLALSFPKDISLEYLEKILSSMANFAKEHNVFLSGGDLSKTENLNLTLTLIGVKDKDVNLLRNQGKVGDIVFLICDEGEFGLSRLALEILENNPADKEKYPSAINAHFYPKLYREETLQLIEFVKKYKNENFSLMDLSDGLAQDLPRLSENYGVALTLEEKNLHNELINFCKENKVNPIEFAIKGGEDYALLGTCPKNLWNELTNYCKKAKKIGILTERKGLFLNNIQLEIKGYDHFN